MKCHFKLLRRSLPWCLKRWTHSISKLLRSFKNNITVTIYITLPILFKWCSLLCLWTVILLCAFFRSLFTSFYTSKVVFEPFWWITGLTGCDNADEASGIIGDVNSEYRWILDDGLLHYYTIHILSSFDFPTCHSIFLIWLW